MHFSLARHFAPKFPYPPWYVNGADKFNTEGYSAVDLHPIQGGIQNLHGRLETEMSSSNLNHLIGSKQTWIPTNSIFNLIWNYCYEKIKSKSAFLHVTAHTHHESKCSFSILSNRLFLVWFEILLKLRDKRVCRYLDVLIHSTLRRNKLTQSKIHVRWSEKRDGEQKRNSREQWSVISNSVNVYLSLFSGEANAIVAKAKARAEGIEKVSLALQQQVCVFLSMIQSLHP